MFRQVNYGQVKENIYMYITYSDQRTDLYFKLLYRNLDLALRCASQDIFLYLFNCYFLSSLCNLCNSVDPFVLSADGLKRPAKKSVTLSKTSGNSLLLFYASSNCLCVCVARSQKAQVKNN